MRELTARQQANRAKKELPASVLITNQKKVYGWKEYQRNGERFRIKATVRHDDECGNGHNSFSVTGTIEEKRGNGRWYDSAGGCIHEEIVKHFPKLAPFIKWHLMSTEGGADALYS